MAEGTYEYECMRAELLGLSKPDKDEFLAQQKERIAAQAQEIEEIGLEEVELQNDDFKNVSGGLDELNNILSITQKKINRFKTVCGSLTNLLKIKVGQSDSTESIPGKQDSEDEKNSPATAGECSHSQTESPLIESCKTPVLNGARKNDLAKALDSQLGKLDTMIEKAENAQYSMAYQSKEMKSFLK